MSVKRLVIPPGVIKYLTLITRDEEGDLHFKSDTIHENDRVSVVGVEGLDWLLTSERPTEDECRMLMVEHVLSSD